MMRRILLALVPLVLSACAGGYPVRVVPLGGDQSQIWVYLQHDNEVQNGIYRCYDEGGLKAYCVKADLRQPRHYLPPDPAAWPAANTATVSP